MRLLFVKRSLQFPRSSGDDVQCFHMMKALAELGAEVSLATVLDTNPRATDGIALAFSGSLSHPAASGAGAHAPIPLTSLQERFRSYWGIERDHIGSVAKMAAALHTDVVIAFGLPALPLLAGVNGPLRVWGMADEGVYHHLSQVKLGDVASWGHVKAAAIRGLYERAFQPLVDRVWAVTETDRRAARWFAGMRVGDLLPIGVDAEFYRPVEQPEMPSSAVFWGRLDFGPNIDALTWFCRSIWPGIIAEVPHAQFTIIGYNPTPAVERLSTLPGVSLMPNLDDLRSAVCRHSVVVLPFISGGGMKTKLLEGAALARAMVCTPHACKDLRGSGALPLVIAASPEDWTRSVVALWRDSQRRAELGAQARQWVMKHYSWSAPARSALAAFTHGTAAAIAPTAADASTRSV
jgi:glycosyltransferase involved in cell wall biosynthesis